VILVAYGLVVTVVPGVWTPFGAKLVLPKIGWVGVFSIAIIFDLSAAFLAFFVLRRMKVPTEQQLPSPPVEHRVPVPAVQATSRG
jgi:hypothetical protein